MAVDRRRELTLRSAGIEVRRYGYELVTRSPQDVLDDLRERLRPKLPGSTSAPRK